MADVVVSKDMGSPPKQALNERVRDTREEVKRIDGGWIEVNDRRSITCAEHLLVL